MKRFDELSVFEVAALTEKELERYIEFALMEAGVVVQPRPLGPSYVNIPALEPAGTVYKVRFKGSNAEVFFKDRDEAMTATGMLSAVRLDAHYDNGVVYILNEEENSRYYGESELSPCHYFRESEHYALEQAKNKNKELCKEYDKAVEEWSDANGSAEDIRADVTNKHINALYRVRHLEDILATREKYIRLSNGDEQIARNFLEKAYSHADIEAAMDYAEWRQGRKGVEAAQ